MKIEPTPELLSVASRVMWFCSPQEGLEQPAVFMAHVMTYATIPDILAVRQALGHEAFRYGLEHAPAGVFDPRSWAYWRLVYGLEPTPLPSRF